jgi:hypothetical protein
MWSPKKIMMTLTLFHRGPIGQGQRNWHKTQLHSIFIYFLDVRCQSIFFTTINEIRSSKMCGHFPKTPDYIIFTPDPLYPALLNRVMVCV